MTTHMVAAPYVTLRVLDDNGQPVLRGFHEGALVPASVNDEDLARHLRKGMITEARLEPVATESEEPPAPSKPNGGDSRAKWADYARSKGAPDSELAAPEDGGLTRDQLRDKYGS
ncbi:hypothetical protein Q0Z83_060250 [Actinoplanes sichuanensis]|uniref:Lsr2 protein n=1 Tax=Actinoplanes sichuanensis TaxID=512349 RepID=A0ABW4A673_9ACTN|nr:hypothetical protein [Actinoplanes sichuanensis]BEL07834.1 hypothetical protein Q0Z83_060250 [Actinoplanes sichuanensis]